jgi:uncharacterized membrane protein
MMAQLAYWKYKIDSSFWFIPGLMTIAGIALSFVMVAIDRDLESRSIDVTPWLYSASPDGARQLLTTIASSVITATSLVFSMMLIALTLASQQLGPRLLESFMRDRINQFVLGSFVATFVYALLVLRAVREGDSGEFVPYCAASMAIALSIVTFGILIFFIHHVAASVQSDAVVARVGRDLESLVDKTLGPDVRNNGDCDARNARRDSRSVFLDDFDASAVGVCLVQSGYLQTADTSSLKRLASERGLRIRLDCRPGHFLVASVPVAFVGPAGRVDDAVQDEIRRALVTGPKRTPAQDMEYEVRVMAEIAIRALSPGINDYYTAVRCVDGLTASLASIMAREFPDPALCDDSGNVVLLTMPSEFGGLVRAAFDDIRQSAQGNTAVTIRLVDAIGTLSSLCRHDGHRRALERQLKMLVRSAEEFVFEPNDRTDVVQRTAAARKSLVPKS